MYGIYESFFLNENEILFKTICMKFITNLFLFSLLFLLLLNIEIKTNNHSILTFLYAFKHKNWNHQIHFYLKSRNGKKNF